jgi:hypothetical protein
MPLEISAPLSGSLNGNANLLREGGAENSSHAAPARQEARGDYGEERYEKREMQEAVRRSRGR